MNGNRIFILIKQQRYTAKKFFKKKRKNELPNSKRRKL